MQDGESEQGRKNANKSDRIIKSKKIYVTKEAESVFQRNVASSNFNTVSHADDCLFPLSEFGIAILCNVNHEFELFIRKLEFPMFKM